ncbi:hypothetical protein Drorol1_Dr00007766 [Drosera rotundifolia]
MRKAKHESLPFKVGDLAESKSFEVGYRGAWFRCKIKDIKHGPDPKHIMQYYDFPDEKMRWIKVYQKPPKKSDEVAEEKELMVRPHYPRTYSERGCPDLEKISEAIVVTDHTWKVGDLADWWTDGCFWSGRVTEIINEDLVKVELPEPPMGEGSSYEVLCKDLRPSLDWSVELGWTLPPSQGHEKGRLCASLIKPEGQGSKMGASSTSKLPKREDLPRQNTPASEDGVETAPGKNPHAARSQSDIGKERSLDGVSSSCVRDGSAKAVPTSEEDQGHDGGPSKKMRTDESTPLSSIGSDTIESVIMDLEELVSKVKWVKRTLEFGTQDPGQPAWEFLEVLGVSPK